GDEREGPEVVDRELDEEVARAPDEAERQEDDPVRVDPGVAVGHDRSVVTLAYAVKPNLGRVAGAPSARWGALLGSARRGAAPGSAADAPLMLDPAASGGLPD